MADESTATVNVSEENVPEASAVPAIFEKVVIESLESSLVVESEQEMVSTEVASEGPKNESVEYEIHPEPVAKLGFVKRWTNKIVSLMKRVFNWIR